METCSTKNTPEKEKTHYTIGEVARMFNVNLSLLRYWEKEFPFICPKKNAKGTRYYSRKNIEDIGLVYHLVKEKKLTLEGAKKRLHENKDGKNKDDATKNYQIVSRLQFIKKEIQEIRKEFGAILSEAKRNSDEQT